jgi:hypothetical protein
MCFAMLAPLSGQCRAKVSHLMISEIFLEEMRVCNKCEVDFNNLIRSLNSKKNLFNNKNESDNSFGGNPQQIETASKAPKNVKWNE